MRDHVIREQADMHLYWQESQKIEQEAPVTAPKITYFSDVLCIWAYAAQARLDEIIHHFGDEVEVEEHFCSVFGDAHTKIEKAWRGKNCFEQFNAHLQKVGEGFDHIKVSDRLWLDARPWTSTSAHIFLKAAELVDLENPSEKPRWKEATWEIRRAFFEDGRDISDWDVRREIAKHLNMDFGAIEAKIKSSEAIAALDADHKLAREMDIAGSPSFVMNEGRQKLYGNVGYHLIKANVDELLRKPKSDEASWC